MSPKYYCFFNFLNTLNPGFIDSKYASLFLNYWDFKLLPIYSNSPPYLSELNVAIELKYSTSFYNYSSEIETSGINSMQEPLRII